MKFLWVLATPFVAARVIRGQQQKPIVEVEGMKPAIGIHFTTSYAVAAVRHEHGEVEDLVRVEAGAEYIELMARWNDWSNRLDCRLNAQQRNNALCELEQTARHRNTGNVAVLSSFLKEIKHAIEKKLGTTITDVLPALPPLAAMDGTDLMAAFSHAGLNWLHVKGQRWPYLRESNAAYAGLGFGLSKEARDDDARLDTWDDEIHREFDESALFLNFDNSSFCAMLQRLQNPYQLPRASWKIDLNLGWWNLPVYEMYEAGRKEHFRKIYEIILGTIEGAVVKPPQKIILLGEHAKDVEFVEVAKNALWDQFELDASLLFEANGGVNSGTIAAKGAAELAFRALLPNTVDRLGAPLIPHLENSELR